MCIWTKSPAWSRTRCARPAAARAVASRLVSEGFRVSVLGMGTGTRSGREQRDLGTDGFVRLVREAYDRGIRYIDTADAYRITDIPPDGHGGIAAMRMAIADAGLKPSDINYVNAHGTSTTVNDKVETLAIKRVFEQQAYRIPISSTALLRTCRFVATHSRDSLALILAKSSSNTVNGSRKNVMKSSASAWSL